MTLKKACLGLSALLWLGAVGAPPAFAGRETQRPAARKGKGPKVVEGEYLILLKEGTSAEERKAAVARVGTVLRDFSATQAGAAGADPFERLLHVKAAPAWTRLGDPQRVAAAIRAAHRSIESVEPEFLEPVEMTPNDAGGGYAQAEMGLPDAWDVATGSANVLVGVIDTGVDYTHPDLADNIWNSPGETGLDGSGNDKRTNGVDDDGNGYVDDWHGWNFTGGGGRVPNDPMPPASGWAFDHGTHVAGIAAAVGNNGQGVCGVAWSARILPLACASWNVEEQQWWISGSGGIAAIYYARELRIRYGVKVVLNMSFGGYGPSESPSRRAAVAAAAQAGVVLVAAAGNDNSAAPHWPSSNPEMVSVAATGPGGVKADFSNHGPDVDAAAPGVGILSTVPGGGYALMEGTSMASPQVAGVAALLLSAGVPAVSGLRYPVWESIVHASTDIRYRNLFYRGRLGAGLAHPRRAMDLWTDSIPPQPPVLGSPAGLGGTRIRLYAATAGETGSDDRWLSGFHVYRRRIGESSFTRDPRWHRGWPIVVDDLLPGETYDFYVQAYDGGGNIAAASNVVTGSTLAVDLPPVTVPSLSGPTWRAPGMEGRYESWAEALESPFITYRFAWGDGTTSDARLPTAWSGLVAKPWNGMLNSWPAGTYLVGVAAIDEYGQAAFSPTLDVEVDDAPPVPPGNLPPARPAPPQGSSVLRPGSIGIFSARTTDPDSQGIRYTFIFTGPANSASTSLWTDPGQTGSVLQSFSVEGVYQVRVYAHDGGASSPISEPFELRVGTTSGGGKPKPELE